MGHRITGGRQQGRSYSVAYKLDHVAVNYTTRLACDEILAYAQKPTVIGFLSRVIVWFNSQGIECPRVIGDNGPANVSNAFAKACWILGLRYIRSSPYTTRTNGKAERYI